MHIVIFFKCTLFLFHPSSSSSPWSRPQSGPGWCSGRSLCIDTPAWPCLPPKLAQLALWWPKTLHVDRHNRWLSERLRRWVYLLSTAFKTAFFPENLGVLKKHHKHMTNRFFNLTDTVDNRDWFSFTSGKKCCITWFTYFFHKNWMRGWPPHTLHKTFSCSYALVSR